MPIGDDVRRLQSKWLTNTGWPKRLEWFEIDGLRGWSGQRFQLRFPIMAIVGENGAGKSTVLQAAASVYKHSVEGKKKVRFASDFFPDTAWETIENASIRWSLREGNQIHEESVRKLARWRGNPKRRSRHVEYIDLSRIQPVPARVGYLTLAKPIYKEAGATAFDNTRLARFSEIMGRKYESAKMARSSADENRLVKRLVPVLRQQGSEYSGFHQGAGETTVAELLERELPDNALILIDEIETSLHPRAQRRLIRHLAARCRERELQILLTTHSPYVLDELPPEARAQIMQTAGEREIVYGVSPDFAMTKMDDIQHHECDLYVEDKRAETMLMEILSAQARALVPRCRVISYGAASVGQSLGSMVASNRFPSDRPSRVFLDGDQGKARGCLNLPGEDPPERVVFSDLKKLDWLNAWSRTGRPFPDFADACGAAMTLTDAHEWVRHAAATLVLSSDVLWQAMCAEWARECISTDQAKDIIEAIEDALAGQPLKEPEPPPRPEPPPQPRPRRPQARPKITTPPSGRLFDA